MVVVVALKSVAKIYSSLRQRRRFPLSDYSSRAYHDAVSLITYLYPNQVALSGSETYLVVW